MLRSLQAVRRDAQGLDETGVFRFQFAEDSAEKKTKKRRNKTKRRPSQIEAGDQDDGSSPVIETRGVLSAEGPNEESRCDELALGLDGLSLETDGVAAAPDELAERTSTLNQREDSVADGETPLSTSGLPTKKKRAKRKGKKRAEVASDSKDDDMLLEEAIAQVRETQTRVLPLPEEDPIHVPDPSVRFKSHRDPEVSDSEARLRRFGRGRNLSAIGPPRRKREEGVWLPPPEKGDRPSAILHSSPFTFGFS